MLEIKGPPAHSVRLVNIREVVGRVLTLLAAAERELGQAQEVAKSSIARASSILVAEIGHSAATPRREGTSALLPWQARRVQDHIERHIGEPIRVCDLSALVCRTEAHFSRAFKQSFGVSPHVYLSRRRIELASQLMIQSSTPLSEIALKCGFNDQAHLCKRFRQHTGATPAAWRRAQLSLNCLS
jgi:transcriptional regulator GlxA family with amidase domain